MNLPLSTEDRFFDLVGNALFAASLHRDLYLRKPTDAHRASLQRAKADFFADLEKFIAEGYAPTSSITPTALARFSDFRDIDWTSGTELNKVVTYLHSLRSTADSPAQPL